MTTAREIRYKQAGEKRNVKVDASEKLDSSESLTGTPVVAEVGGSDLTIADEAVNSAEMTVKRDTEAAKRGYKFSVSGGTAGKTYELKITCSTNDSVAQNFEDYVTIGILETPS